MYLVGDYGERSLRKVLGREQKCVLNRRHSHFAI